MRLKWVYRTALVVAGCILLLLIVARIAVATGPGRHLAERLIEEQQIAGMQFEIIGLQGDLFSNVSVESIHASDAQGVWLEAKNVRLNWTARHLLTRKVTVNALRAENITLHRAPQREANNTQKNGVPEPPTLPVIRLGELEIKEFQYQEQVYHINGNGQTARNIAQVRLNLVPANAQDDRIAADLEWRRNEPLRGTVTAYGAPGGLFATLLSLPEDTASSLELTTLHEDETATFELALALNGEDRLTAQGAWTGNDRAVRGRADLTAFPVLERISTRLGATLNFAAQQADNGALVISARTDHVDFSAELPANPESRLPQFTGARFSALTDNLSTLITRPDIGAKQAQINGTVLRRKPDIHIDTELSFSDLFLPGFGAQELTAKADTLWNPDNEILTITGEAASILKDENTATTRIIGHAQTLYFDASYARANGRVTLSTGSLTFPDGSFTYEGTINQGAAAISLSGLLNYTTPDGPIPQMDLVWSLSRDSTLPLTLQLQGTADAGSTVAGMSSSALDAPLRVSAAATLDGARRELKALKISGDGIDITARAVQESGQLSADLNARLNDLSTEKVALSGPSVTARITQDGDVFPLTLSLAAHEARYGSQEIIMPQLELTGQYAQDTLAVASSLKGTYRNQPLNISAQARQSGNRWSAENIALSWAEYQLAGTLSGTGTASDTLRGNISIRSQTATEPLPLINGELSLTDSGFDGLVELGRLDRGPLRLAMTQLELGGVPNAPELTVTSRGTLLQSGLAYPLSLTSILSRTLGTSALTLVLDGEIDGNNFATSTPAKISWSEGMPGFDARLDLFGGAAQLNYQAGASPTLDANWKNINVRPLLILAGRAPLLGNTEGALSLVGNDALPEGTLSIAITGMTTSAGSTPLKATMAGDITLGTAVLNLSAFADDQFTATAAAELPLAPGSVWFLPRPDRTAPVNGTLQAQGALDTLWPLLGLEQIYLGGMLSTDVDFTGSLNDIEPAGSLSLSNGQFEEGTAGILLTDLGLTATLEPQAIIINSLTAKGARGGSLSGNGQYDFSGAGAVNVDLDQLQALARADLSATLSGQLDISRANREMLIRGILEINRSQINSDRLNGQRYVTMPVDFSNGNDTNAHTSRQHLPVNLDIRLQTDRGITFTGSGLESLWGADLRLRGTRREPQLVGTASLVRGDIDLAGRRFVFEDSTIQFSGAPTAAVLNLRAVRQTEALTAIMQISGTTGAPSLSLTSEPALPQDEVLSRVLFGRSPSELTAFEAAQMAASLAALSSGGSLDLIGPLQDLVGLDRLDFGSADDGSATVNAGEYIGDDLYLELRSSLRGIPGIGIEWTPRPNIQVGTELDSEAEPRFTVRWKRDFGLKEKE